MLKLSQWEAYYLKFKAAISNGFSSSKREQRLCVKTLDSAAFSAPIKTTTLSEVIGG